MGKPLADLGLTDAPLPASARPADQDAVDFLGRLHQLKQRAAWAVETLEGIGVTVAKTNRITDGQRRAVANIEAAADRQADRPYQARGSSRRWSGPPEVKPGHCRRCRRLLTDAESIRLGIGPECREREASGE